MRAHPRVTTRNNHTQGEGSGFNFARHRLRGCENHLQVPNAYKSDHTRASRRRLHHFQRRIAHTEQEDKAATRCARYRPSFQTRTSSAGLPAGHAAAKTKSKRPLPASSGETKAVAKQGSGKLRRDLSQGTRKKRPALSKPWPRPVSINHAAPQRSIQPPNAQHGEGLSESKQPCSAGHTRTIARHVNRHAPRLRCGRLGEAGPPAPSKVLKPRLHVSGRTRPRTRHIPRSTTEDFLDGQVWPA